MTVIKKTEIKAYAAMTNDGMPMVAAFKATDCSLPAAGNSKLGYLTEQLF